jgi:hypothetical protein
MAAPTSTPISTNEYVGQDVDGENDAGCPFIGQTVDDAVNNDSLSFVASTLGISVEELRAML